MMQESIWFDRLKFEQDLEHYQMFVHNNLPVLSEAGDSAAKPEQKKPEQKKQEAKKKEKNAQSKVEETKGSTETNTLTSEIEKARRAIESTLSGLSTSVSDHLTSSDGRDVSSRVDALESENRALRELLSKLTIRVESLEARLVKAEGGAAAAPCQAAPAIKEEAKKETKEDDDDDFDMFGDSDEDEEEETEEEKKIREEKLAKYHAKKAGKKAVIAKSSLTLNVKPWDDETDMKKMEECVRSIEMDGLVWGGSKLVPVAFSIKMLQILCVVEDAKVSTDDLQEKISEFEDYVQSTDIAAFNKI